MVALDIEPDGNGGAPELARRALLEARLVVNATGPATIRLEPPLYSFVQAPDQFGAPLPLRISRNRFKWLKLEIPIPAYFGTQIAD